MSGYKNSTWLLLLGALSLLAPSCGKEEPVPGANASGIVFSPGAYGGAQTKTSYTGDGSFTGTAPNRVLTHERIDWVNNDIFTVVCAQAQVYDKSSTPWTLSFSHSSPIRYSESDYKVQTHQTDGNDNTVSRASIVPVDGNGLQWGSGQHTFYAMYPSVNSAAFTAAEKAKIGINTTSFKGTIPTAQTPQWSNNGWPQMQYAYMFAAPPPSAEAREVKLPFYPQFTAFEFTVTSGEHASVALTSFSFDAVTANTPVTGDFQLQNAAPGGTPSTPTGGSTSSRITVDLTGKTVTPGAPLKFTVLGLPADMGAMRMSFTGPAIGTRTVILKKKNTTSGQFEEIQFTARKKYRISGIEFPKDLGGGGEQIIWDQEAFGEDILWDNEYVLEGIIPASLETSHFGGTVTVATDFRSCQVDGSTASPEPFTFQYSDSGTDGSWTDGLPAWLSPDAGTDLGGAATATSLSLALSPLSTAGTPRSSYVRILQTNTGESTDACLFMTEIMLSLKEKMTRQYPVLSEVFDTSAGIIEFIESRFYLYEIIQYISDTLDIAMNRIYCRQDGENVIEDIISYIDRFYAQPLTLEELAVQFGYNSGYLGRLFTKTTGCGFTYYLNECRIKKAKELLSEGKYKVYEVSQLVGYSDVDYFGRKFRKHAGLTPAEFKKL